MDKNLYNQFENYQPVLLNKNNPNDMLKAYNFMLIDLQLYLGQKSLCDYTFYYLQFYYIKVN